MGVLILIFNVLYKNKALLIVSSLFYIISFILGYFLISEFDKNFNTSSLSVKHENTLDTLSLVINNLKIIVLCSLGVLSFGIFTFISILINGLSHGVLTKIAFQSTDVSTVLIFTLPHGLLEIPGIWIAGASGLKGTWILVQYLKGKDISIMTEIKEFAILFTLSILLIVIAGIIEANFTIKLARW